MSEKGHIELERQIDSITVGVRLRHDLGDLAALMRSIEEVGLLQPITVTPEGALVCGLRRLEAMRQLGRRTLSVWVRAGISDRLSHLLAQQDENEQHKPLTPIETARLYAEIHALELEDAARRQASTRFGCTTRPAAKDGAGDSPGPVGDSRTRAAQKVTGKDSWQRLEQINWISAVADDESHSTSVRDFASNMLREIEADGPVAPAYKRVQAAVELARTPPADPGERNPVDAVAAAALKRVEGTARADASPALKAKTKPSPRHHSTRSFALMWTELEGWTELCDVDQLARELKDDDWVRFERVVAATVDLLDRVRNVRTRSVPA